MNLRDIEWEDYLPEDSEQPFPLPSINDIQEADSILGCSLPEDYKNVLMLHQGQLPEDLGIKVEQGTEPIGCLFHVFKDGPSKTYSIFSKRKRLLEDGNTDLIPFTDNSSSSRFCFDFSKNKLNPAIVFVDSDYELDDPDAITFVANSFTEFLNLAEDD